MLGKIESKLGKTAAKLSGEKIVEYPEWAKFVKTGINREKSPQSENWWYLRSASILRKIYLKGPIGAEKLSKEYGGLQNRGSKPDRFKRGSRKIIRVIMQQLEDKNLVKKSENLNKGRIITKEGLGYLSE
ncbi:MAG: 40S ribosomal protein S19 [Candidatus Aenigmarchaeota archaeon]|nr:40S ribosomal protein S19 [Candidatus Aenigmarchaeota archaeon]